MVSRQDLIEAKKRLGTSLFRTSLQGGVIGMAAAIDLKLVIARANQVVHLAMTCINQAPPTVERRPTPSRTLRDG